MGIDIENLTVLDIFKLGQFCLLKTIGPPPFKSVAQICKSLNISLEDLPFTFSLFIHPAFECVSRTKSYLQQKRD
jgi:hypothetical protein